MSTKRSGLLSTGIRFFSCVLVATGLVLPQSYSRWEDTGGSQGVYYRWASKLYHSKACVVDVEDTRKARKTAGGVTVYYTLTDPYEKSQAFTLLLTSNATQTFYLDDCAAVTHVMVVKLKRS